MDFRLRILILGGTQMNYVGIDHHRQYSHLTLRALRDEDSTGRSARENFYSKTPGGGPPKNNLLAR